MGTTITIIDYGLGNLRSVMRGIEAAGARAVITGNADEIAAADGIVLPGVGAFHEGMDQLGPPQGDGLCCGKRCPAPWHLPWYADAHGLKRGTRSAPGSWPHPGLRAPVSCGPRHQGPAHGLEHNQAHKREKPAFSRSPQGSVCILRPFLLCRYYPGVHAHLHGVHPSLCLGNSPRQRVRRPVPARKRAGRSVLRCSKILSTLSDPPLPG